MTAKQLCNRFGIHPTLVNRWRKQLIAGPGTIFSPGQDTRGARKAPGHDKLADELEWLKKNSSLSIEMKLSLIDGSDPEL